MKYGDLRRRTNAVFFAFSLVLSLGANVVVSVAMDDRHYLAGMSGIDALSTPLNPMKAGEAAASLIMALGLLVFSWGLLRLHQVYDTIRVSAEAEYGIFVAEESKAGKSPSDAVSAASSQSDVSLAARLELERQSCSRARWTAGTGAVVAFAGCLIRWIA